jgi:hypothetical protein
LSQALTGLLEKLLRDNGPIAHALDELNKWLVDVTKKITEDNLREWIEGFISGFGKVAKWTGDFVKGLADLLRWFGITPAEASTGGTGGISGGVGRGAGGRSGSAGDASAAGAGRPGSANPEKRANAMKIAMDQLRKEGVPEDKLEGAAALLVGEAESESGLKANISHDNGTGYGIYGARLRRRDEMFEWMAKHGYGRDSFEGQMRQMAHAAASGEWAGPEGKRAEARRLIMQGATDVGSVNRFTGSFESPARINARAGSVWAAKNSMKTRVTIKKTPGNDSTEAASAASQQTP